MHFPNHKDSLLWTGSNNGVFLVKSCHALACSKARIEGVTTLWKLLWGSKLHERLKMFSWRLVIGVIPTKSVLGWRLGSNDLACILCGLENETLVHLFKDCHISRVVAFAGKWGYQLDSLEGDLMENILSWILNPIRGDDVTLIFISFFYVL